MEVNFYKYLEKFMILNIIKSKFQVKKIYKNVKMYCLKNVKIIIINNNKL